MRKVVSSDQNRNVLITLFVTVCLYVGCMVSSFFLARWLRLIAGTSFEILTTGFDS